MKDLSKKFITLPTRVETKNTILPKFNMNFILKNIKVEIKNKKYPQKALFMQNGL